MDCFLDASNAVNIVFLDICKAFDSVPQKLFAYAWHLRLDIATWLTEVLGDRLHRVVLNQAMSDTSGIHQRSVLGPLLFLLNVSDTWFKVT